MWRIVFGSVALSVGAWYAAHWLGWSQSTSSAMPEAPTELGTTSSSEPLFSAPKVKAAAFGASSREPIVVPNCQLNVYEKFDLSSQREGKILIIGTEVDECDGELADRLVVFDTPSGPRRFHRLREGDHIRSNQVLAYLDDRVAKAEVAGKKAKTAAARAELVAAQKTHAEAYERFQTQQRLLAMKATSNDEVRAAKLIMEKNDAEVLAKKEMLTIAELEHEQATITLSMHELYSPFPGVVKSIFKKWGEGVKSLDPILQVQNYAKLRVEGLLEIENRPYLRHGMKAFVEYSPALGPIQRFRDHLLPVTAVSVCSRGRVISASEDGTVRLYDPVKAIQVGSFGHTHPIRCLAATPVGAVQNVCLLGAGNGEICVWNLDTAQSSKPEHVLPEKHRGAVLCVAVSPDGKFAASGGEDREILVWNLQGLRLHYRLSAAHRAAVTSMHFTPDAKLVTAGRDNTLNVWNLTQTEATCEHVLDRRSGNVANLGVSADGQYVLFDQGRNLRILSLRDRSTRSVLENSTDGSPFSTFALFSPDHRFVATSCAADGQLHLWRTPSSTIHAHKVCNFVTQQTPAATCACFSPDGRFLVTGSKDNQVLIWPLPTDAPSALQAEVTFLEEAVESGSRHVRLWAEVNNKDGLLLPGTGVNLAIYPR